MGQSRPQKERTWSCHSYRFLADRHAVEEYLRGLRGEPAWPWTWRRQPPQLPGKGVPGPGSTSQGHAVLDPLASREALQELAPLLADPGTEKILHGGDYDVRLLKKDFGFEVKNLFDTMIAASSPAAARWALRRSSWSTSGSTLDKPPPEG